MKGRPAGASAALLCLAAACGTVQAQHGSFAPANSCQEHPCSAYAQSPIPTCAPDGTCATVAPSKGITLLVSLPEDSYFAPYLQFVVPIEHLADPCTPRPPKAKCGCTWPECGHLPGFGSVSGGYLISTCVQSPPPSTPTQQVTCAAGLGFFLGNQNAKGDTVDTALPVHATYRLLKDQWQDPIPPGLPLQPLRAAQTVNNSSPDPGPNGSSALEFLANLQPGTYERTIVPDPPYDAVFGPEVRGDVTVNGSRELFERVVVDSFDVTKKIPEIGHATLPTFDISRDVASSGDSNVYGLDGWTAFLRDATTKQVISNIRALSGALTKGVQLVTNHATPSAPDALTNAELVVAPPSGVPFPTGVFAPPGEFPAAEQYPHLPPPVTITGSVTGPGPDGRSTPVAADLVFEALAFTADTGPFAGMDTYALFEFVGHAPARPIPAGQSTYTVTLPVGPYRVSVRPLDGSAATAVTALEIKASGTKDFALEAPRTVRGSAVLADGRALAGAIVDALPQQCPTSPAFTYIASTVGLKPIETTQWCLPRPQQAVTDDAGSFTLQLDSGGYSIRARPADGTRLPWVTQSLPAGQSTVNLVVPAPFRESFRLVDPDDIPIVHAVVRAFVVPGPAGPAGDAGMAGGAGQAEELGQAITDAAGNLDLYLALPQ